jgi:hypothetical protein
VLRGAHPAQHSLNKKKREFCLFVGAPSNFGMADVVIDQQIFWERLSKLHTAWTVQPRAQLPQMPPHLRCSVRTVFLQASRF